MSGEQQKFIHFMDSIATMWVMELIGELLLFHPLTRTSLIRGQT